MFAMLQTAGLLTSDRQSLTVENNRPKVFNHLRTPATVAVAVLARPGPARTLEEP
jgi:hypothetical protein